MRYLGFNRVACHERLWRPEIERVRKDQLPSPSSIEPLNLLSRPEVPLQVKKIETKGLNDLVDGSELRAALVEWGEAHLDLHADDGSDRLPCALQDR